MNKVNRIILVIIDDVRSDQFFTMIDQGLLPTFKKLMQNGLYSKNCVTDFPSITYPTQVSTITGTYTGDYKNELCHGVPTFNWMGRDFSPPLLRSYGSNKLEIYKMNQDLGTNCQTMPEMIKEGNKTSITQYINRGTNYFFPENKRKLIFFYLVINYWKNVKRLIEYANSIVIHKLLSNFKNPKKFFDTKEPPICSLLWFMSSDILMHRYGSKSQIYRLNLMHIDKVIGKMIHELDRLGYLDDTAIAITSDHGNYDAKDFGNLQNNLKNLGLDQYHKNHEGNLNIGEFGGVGFFYLKGNLYREDKNQWGYPTLDELKNFGPKQKNLTNELFKVKGSTLIYYRDNENSTHKGQIFLKRKIKGKNSFIEGKLEYRGSGKDMKTRYIFENGQKDVFGYFDDNHASKIVDGRFHKISEWLEHTYHLDYPLYPDLLVRHFKNPRSADLILSTQGDIVYNIAHGKQKRKTLYKHDIGTQESTIVPLLISGSEDIPRKEIKFCKITDIVPTLLGLLGQKSHESVIGKNLINK